MRLDEVARARRDPGLVILEGFHAVKHALRFGAELLGVWTADPDEIAALVARLAPDIALAPTVVEAAELAKLVPRAQVVAVARRPAQLDPDGIVAQAGPAPVILLEEPRHLGNLGACVRVAAAAGAAGVITTGVQDPWHPDALRGSAGLHFALPVARSRVIRTGDRPLIALDPADARLALPMRAGVSSLNLATAVSGVLFALQALTAPRAR
jgi:TrmH family RNA methyltransferase